MVSVGTSLHDFEAAKKVKNLKLLFQDVGRQGKRGTPEHAGRKDLVNRKRLKLERGSHRYTRKQEG